jgi:tetratricopeptide (TPR) repeat protein
MMLRLLPAATPFLFLFSSCLAPSQAPAEGPDSRQVYWQRSLHDALALCKATGRPLLIAVNMDGESASDRIVHENYRDPAFVASTRRCVCLGASVFRHNARDHDDQGRRIPCPRFGEITCGEHMALEPVLYEKYLSDGDRVAPRHTMILPDGKKAFDLSLSFDLQDIDRALAAAVVKFEPLPNAGDRGDWASLAARRDHRGRAALEAALASASDEATLRSAVAAIVAHGDVGSMDAMRQLAVRWPELSGDLAEQVLAAMQELGPTEWFAVLQGLCEAPETSAACRRALLSSLLGHRSKATPVQKSYLLANSAVGVWFGPAPETYRLIVSLTDLLQAAQVVTSTGGALPRAGGPTDAMPDAEALQRRLEELDAEAQARRDDPQWQAAFAKASLDLGRRHLESGARDTQLLLEDAASHFAKALAQQPQQYEWWVERARAAYFLGRFREEVEYGERALKLATGKETLPQDGELLASGLLENANAIEALRWIGDGHARLLTERAGKDPFEEGTAMVAGLRAVGIAAVSPYGYEADWLGFASFCGALGLQREELAILECGAGRLPASRELRQALNAALYRCGRPDLAPVVAERIARSRAPSADSSWFAGYAWILAAEDDRRSERPRAAAIAYGAARDWFESAETLKPEYQDSCRQMRALALVGRGMSCVQVWPDRDEPAAASCLCFATEQRSDLSQLKDGLGCDVFDLVDKIVEWRAKGAQPMPPLALLSALDKVAPADPFWAAAVSDSALREALRADGRSPERKERETVDAGGKKITMLMGLPNEEGDRWLRESIEAGRRAAQRAKTDADKLPLAQADTIWAERMLERNRTDGVQEALVEAAGLMHVDPPAANADRAALSAVAAKLRGLLGDARPRLREGR